MRRYLAAASADIPRSTTNSGVGGSAVYESAKAVDEYLQFHFGNEKELVPYNADIVPSAALGFTLRCANLGLLGKGRTRALDIGCAVGGMSFELAKNFESVVGIDFSHAFVAAAEHMRSVGTREYTAVIEGTVVEKRTASVDPSVERTRMTFKQGDACDLPKDIGKFDAIIAANLLCRLPDPRAFLDRLPSLLNPGGVVVIVSPYSWLPEYTAREKWLGGGINGLRGREAMSNIMRSNGLELVEGREMPFLIREHERKFQWGCSDGTVWRMK